MYRWMTAFVLAVFVFGAANRAGADDKEPLVLEGHESAVTGVVFLGDGKVLASSSVDKTVKLWNVAEKKELTTLKGHENRIQALAASPDGKALASGDDGGVVRVWDVAAR